MAHFKKNVAIFIQYWYSWLKPYNMQTFVIPNMTLVLLLDNYWLWNWHSVVLIFVSTCKISRLIDLQYGTKNKKFYTVSSHFEYFWIFSSIFAKFQKSQKISEKSFFPWLRNFRASVKISLPYHIISFFSRSKQNA